MYSKNLITDWLLATTTIILVCLTFEWTAWGKPIDCDKHKIYCHIDQLRPTLDYNFKMKLSNVIYRYSKLYKINPEISVAVLMQENRFRNKHRYEYVDVIHEDGTIEEVRGITDYGIAQLHRGTVRDYNFDIKKLLDKDLDYTIKCHLRILGDKIKLCKSKDKPWACYHSRTEIFHNQYIPLVERFFRVKHNRPEPAATTAVR